MPLGTCSGLKFTPHFRFLPGCSLRGLAGGYGSRQLCQHYGDTATETEVQSKDEESKEQTGSPTSKLTGIVVPGTIVL